MRTKNKLNIWKRLIWSLTVSCFMFSSFGQTKNEIIGQLTTNNNTILKNINSIDSIVFINKFDLIKLNSELQKFTNEFESQKIEFKNDSLKLSSLLSNKNDMDLNLKTIYSNINLIEERKKVLNDSTNNLSVIFSKLKYSSDSLNVLNQDKTSNYYLFKGDIGQFSRRVIPQLNSTGFYSLVRYNTSIPLIDSQFIEIQFFKDSDLCKVRLNKFNSDWRIFNSEKLVVGDEFKSIQKIGDFYILDFEIYNRKGTSLGSISKMIISKINDFKIKNLKIHKNGQIVDFDESTFLKNSIISEIEISENELQLTIDENDYILKYNDVNEEFNVELKSFYLFENTLGKKREIISVGSFLSRDSENYLLQKNIESGAKFSKDFDVKNDTKTGKLGIVDSKGNILLNFIYDSISEFHFGYSIVELSGIKYLIDTKGFLLTEDLNKVKILPERFLNDYIVLLSNGDFFNLFTKKIIVTDKSVRIADLINNLKVSFNCGLIKIVSNDKYGFMGVDGKILIQPQFKSVTSFDNGFAITYDENDNLSIIDLKGKKINDKKYSTIYSLDEKYNFPNSNCCENAFGLVEGLSGYFFRDYPLIDGFFELFYGFFKVKREGRIFYVDLNGKEYLSN